VLELAIMVPVIVWFVRMGRLRGQGALLWGFVGAVSFYGPIFIFSRLVAPALFGTLTFDSPVSLLFGVSAGGYVLGIISCLLARRSLMRTQPKSIEFIIGALRDKNPKVRRMAAEALHHSNDARVVEPLLSALQDDDHEVRINAATALSRLKDDRTTEPFILALKDNNPDVRRIASDALGCLCDARAVAPLIPLLGEYDPNIRDAAKDALKNITGQDFGYDRAQWEVGTEGQP
jgi:HEAT repeats